MKKNKSSKFSSSNLKITILTTIVFFITTMLFREFFNVMSVMGIRPSALPPVLGLVFGPFGVLGCVLGNLIADIVSGYAPLMIILGFVAQCTYGILPLLMWRAFNELKKKPLQPIRLNKSNFVLRYIIIVSINAIITSSFLGSIMQSLGISSFVSTTTLMLLLNNFVFCIVLGIPIIVAVSIYKLKFSKMSLSMNERMVLIFLLASIISGLLIGIFVVVELSYAIADPVTMWMRIYMYVAINLLGFYVIAIAFLRYCEKNITIPVETITKVARNYISDDKERKESTTIIAECEKLISNKNGNLSEAGILAQAFKQMALDIDAYIDHLTAVMSENERIATELNVARQIQSDILPQNFPAFPERDEFKIYATMQSAKEIGGDFYDFFLIDNDHLCIVIGDVSGKGIPAALFMVTTKTLINNCARSGEDPKNVFANVSNQLCEGNENAMFVTAWLGILQISTRKVIYVNAGHNPPIVKKRDGSCEYLKTRRGLMLAGMIGTKYVQEELQLDRGDLLFLYTDGVTEANNLEAILYGQERLLVSLTNVSNATPFSILDYLKSEIDNFADGAPQFDDIAMLALSIEQ